MGASGTASDTAKPRLLVVTVHPWKEGTSLGSTFSNIFAEYAGVIGHLYMRPRSRESSLVGHSFSISDTDALKSILFRGRNPTEVEAEGSLTEKVYHGLRPQRPSFALLARELIWRLSGWRSGDLEDFLTKLRPTAIFAVVTDARHHLRIAESLAGLLDIPLYLYIMDDVLALNGSITSKLMKAAIERNLRRLTTKAAGTFYIVEELRDEYEERLESSGGVILRKAMDPSVHKHAPEEGGRDMNLVFSGNLNLGRLQVLDAVAKQLGACPVKATLHIYSSLALTPADQSVLEAMPNAVFHGSVHPDRLPDIWSRADVLVHVESFLDATSARLSFSTKLVDYLSAGRCILALGNPSLASMRYLARHDAAIIVPAAEDIADGIVAISDSTLREDYARAALKVAESHHSRKAINEALDLI